MSVLKHIRTLGPARGRQSGLSIIELMVGIVISMIVGLAATSTAVVFTASQRQGIGVGGVAVNANTALAALKNDAATSGLGFFGDSRYLCSKLNLSVGTTATWDGASFTPVLIKKVSGLDQVDVLQSSRVESGANVLLQTDSTGTSAAVKSYLPAQVGDAVLLSPESVGVPCLVRSVTAVTASTADTPQTLTFTNTGAHNQATFTTNPTYIRAGGGSTSGGGGVTLLGTLRWNRYRMVGTDLVLEHPLDGATAVIARNVMLFRAQYGTAAAGTASLASWDDASGGTWGALDSTTIPRVRAVRIGVVTRSPQRDKSVDSGGVCNTTTTLPQLFGTTITPDVTDWKCYRYRSAVLVVPLRNLVLGMTLP